MTLLISLVWSMKYGLSGDERIGSLRDEVERLREQFRRRERDANKLQQENDRQKRQIDGLRRQDERQKREIEDLKRQLATARRAGFRQAAPFAKNRPQGRGRRCAPAFSQRWMPRGEFAPSSASTGTGRHRWCARERCGR